jgi:hypothetical protein
VTKLTLLSCQDLDFFWRNSWAQSTWLHTISANSALYYPSLHPCIFCTSNYGQFHPQKGYLKSHQEYPCTWKNTPSPTSLCHGIHVAALAKMQSSTDMQLELLILCQSIFHIVRQMREKRIPTHFIVSWWQRSGIIWVSKWKQQGRFWGTIRIVVVVQVVLQFIHIVTPPPPPLQWGGRWGWVGITNGRPGGRAKQETPEMFVTAFVFAIREGDWQAGGGVFFPTFLCPRTTAAVGDGASLGGTLCDTSKT